MTIGMHRVREIFCLSDMNAVRMLLAIAETLWAINLYWPGDTFERPTYAGMALVMEETTWAFVFLVSATIQLSIVFGGRCNGSFAASFAAWNSVLWIFICASMYASVYPPPAAISGELALTIGALWVLIKTNPKERTNV